MRRDLGWNRHSAPTDRVHLTTTSSLSFLFEYSEGKMAKWPLQPFFFKKKEKMKNMCFRCLAQFTAHRRSFRTMASCLSRGSRRSRLRGKSSGASDSFRRWFQEPGGWVSKHATATRLELNSTGALWARVWRTRLGYLPTG